MFVEELRNKAEWEGFLQASSNGTFYHSLKWKEVIQRSFAHPPLYLAIRDLNGGLVGICPGFILGSGNMKIYHSTPYSDYGGPIIAEHCVERASSSLLGFLQSFCSSNGIAYAKICFTDGKSLRSFQSPLRYVDSSTGVMRIDLKATPSYCIWNKVFSARMRKKIRQMERVGFQAEEAKTKSDLRDFYALYNENMKYIGASPFTYEFMENIWNLLYPENFRIWVLGKDRRIGGIAVFKHGGWTYWVYVGIDRKRSGHYSVIPYLVWQEIRKAEEEGYRYVSLGSTPSDPRDTHHLQKKDLGASFCQQKMVWYPFNYTGRILLLTRSKAVGSWKTIRAFLPLSLRRILENRLSAF
jgi:hypothetical protein